MRASIFVNFLSILCGAFFLLYCFYEKASPWGDFGSILFFIFVPTLNAFLIISLKKQEHLHASLFSETILKRKYLIRQIEEVINSK